jgi:hypothetical protein
MQLPRPRGPISSSVFAAMRREPGRPFASALSAGAARASNALDDEDRHIALWSLYELHYAGFDDVDDRWEWSPDALRLRALLEDPFEAALRAAAADAVAAMMTSEGDVSTRLFDLIDGTETAPLAGYIQRDATRRQALEYLRHRSVYQLKEADPHTWVVPRLTGQPKVSLTELQFDEYGGGRYERLHARMFADSLTGAGLNADYGAYVDVAPASTLAISNAVSMFGLHRRLRGAAMGHLAAFEATSSVPARRVAMGLRRLAFPEVVAAYFDEHVEADAVHEQLAVRDICANLVHDAPSLLEDVAFGAAACQLLDDRSARHQLGSWADGRSSLRVVDDATALVA